MSNIWNYMKKTTQAAAPAEIERGEAGGLRVRWQDGAVTSASARELRLGCQCASCVDEFTHRPLLDPASVAADIAIASLDPVGNYAIHLVFSDGHDSGIYAWPLLRSLGKAG